MKESYPATSIHMDGRPLMEDSRELAFNPEIVGSHRLHRDPRVKRGR